MTARDWTIRLIWTKPPISDNSRLHWTAQHRIKQRIRSGVRVLVSAARVPELSRCSVNVEYVPRDRRRRDTDNLSALRKIAADAVVDCGVVPDDTPEYMAKPEPVIHPADPRDPRLLLVITDLGGA